MMEGGNLTVLGVTGQIGTGKTTLSGLIAEEAASSHHRKAAIFDADQVVQNLRSQDPEVQQQLMAIVPEAQAPGEGTDTFNEASFVAAVFDHMERLPQLETLLFPHVKTAAQDFISKSKQSQVTLVILDVPKLFESGLHDLCDKIVFTEASPQAQSSRVLARPGMTPQRLQQILHHQKTILDNKANADFVIQTDRDLGYTHTQLAEVLTQILGAKK